MMAYSTEERVEALRHCSRGLKDDEVSVKLGISKQSITNWKKLLFTTGSLEKKKSEKKPRKPYKYTPEKINDLLDKSIKPKDSWSSKVSNLEERQRTTNNRCNWYMFTPCNRLAGIYEPQHYLGRRTLLLRLIFKSNY